MSIEKDSAEDLVETYGFVVSWCLYSYTLLCFRVEFIDDQTVVPVCLGPRKSAIRISKPKKQTCVMCQDSAEVDGKQRAVVCPAFVQK